MRRREFIKAIAGGMVAAPFAARAQKAAKRVGVLVIGRPDPASFWRVFRDAMHALGYVEGRNIVYEFRSADGDAARLPELAAELVRLRVDAIVTWFTPTVQAARQATADIPIIMADAGDPVGTGLVASLARPGGNITGIAGITAELAGKCIDIFREMLPSVRRIAVLCNVADPFSKPFLEHVEAASRQAGLELQPSSVHPGAETEAAFPKMRQDKADALLIQPSLLSERAIRLALDARLPAASISRWFAETGGLLSYNPIEAEIFRAAADYTARVLKGARPAELPVQQPTEFELVINRKTAQALGIEITDRLTVARAAVLVD